jgi:uncharacterized protein with GYD domain
MAKFLAKANYTQAGVQGLLNDGGSKRRDVVTKLAESLGGRVESFYYAFGDTDIYAVFDFPDGIGAAAASLVVSAAGGAEVTMTALLTPEEVDEAAKRSADYTAPGS